MNIDPGTANIAALVSGGVDSSVVAHLLCSQGFKPTVFYIRIGMEDENGYMGCSAEEDIEITSFICKKYGCRFEVVSLQKEYWDTVVAYTLRTVKNGYTPNPDVMCNRLIKFGAFIDKFGGEFDKVATGHYARNLYFDGKWHLATAADKHKDQTDFLARITYSQLEKIMFPIGDLPKAEVRRIAMEQGLPSATRKDSQGICFLGKINYAEFIKKYLGTKPGKIVEKDSGKVLGVHQGYWFHTIGQRKGLGLSGGPWYVVGKDVEDNIVYVSNGYDTEEQYGRAIPLSDLQFISDGTLADTIDGTRVAFKIRHTPEFNFGTVRREGYDKFTLYSENKIQGIAPGQFGVLYDEACNICYGSGVIV